MTALNLWEMPQVTKLVTSRVGMQAYRTVQILSTFVLDLLLLPSRPSRKGHLCRSLDLLSNLCLNPL